MRKKNLEQKLQKVESFEEPEAELEQYRTPPSVASILLWSAYLQGDIENRKVYDLGCGTGILAIGARLLGASKVIAIDRDSKAIEQARGNSEKLSVDVDFRVEDINEVKGKGDTVVQNPPFGSQKKGNDRPFIERALGIAPVVYSMHLTQTDDFIQNFVREQGARVEEKVPVSFELPRSMPWHEKEKETINITIYRLVKRDEL